MKSFLVCFLFFTFSYFQAQNIVVLGKRIPLQSDYFSFEHVDSLTSDLLKNVSMVLIFSTANSKLDSNSEKVLMTHLENGGSVYLGCENEPFNAECSQVISNLFNFQLYGNFQEDTLELASSSNFSALKESDSGFTTVAFPLDYRFKVEAWSNDNPIIVSTKIGKGKLILDGGYSRFNNLEKNKLLFQAILDFLKQD